MPSRKVPLITGEVYHLFNKILVSEDILANQSLALKLLETFNFYRTKVRPLKFSQYRNLNPKMKVDYHQRHFKVSNFRTDILAHNVMGNHFHLLVEQKNNDGIMKMMKDSINSFTRYFNLKNNRRGPLFLTQFKAKRITTEELFLHVSRYIHIQQFTAGTVSDFKGLLKIPQNSLKKYTKYKRSEVVNPKPILSHFDKDPNSYMSFCQDRMEYQKTLEECKYTNKWI